MIIEPIFDIIKTLWEFHCNYDSFLQGGLGCPKYGFILGFIQNCYFHAQCIQIFQNACLVQITSKYILWFERNLLNNVFCTCLYTQFYVKVTFLGNKLYTKSYGGFGNISCPNFK